MILQSGCRVSKLFHGWMLGDVCDLRPRPACKNIQPSPIGSPQIRLQQGKQSFHRKSTSSAGNKVGRTLPLQCVTEHEVASHASTGRLQNSERLCSGQSCPSHMLVVKRNGSEHHEQFC